jgi:hypothetical protein
MPMPRSSFADVIQVLAAAVLGFILTLGYFLIDIKISLARHPPPRAEGDVYGILLPSIAEALAAAAIVIIFTIRRRRRTDRMIPSRPIS